LSCWKYNKAKKWTITELHLDSKRSGTQSFLKTAEKLKFEPTQMKFDTDWELGTD